MAPSPVIEERSDEAIMGAAKKVDCFAEPVIGAHARDPVARNAATLPLPNASFAPAREARRKVRRSQAMTLGRVMIRRGTGRERRRTRTPQTSSP